MQLGRTNGLRTAIAVLIAGLVVSQAALADRWLDDATPTRTVDIRPLNLASQAGAQEAYRRIAAAAQSICGTMIIGKSGVARVRDRRDHMQPCFDAAVKSALDQIAKRTGIDLKKTAGLDSDSLVAGR